MNSKPEQITQQNSATEPWLRIFGISTGQRRTVVAATLNALVTGSTGKLRGRTDRHSAYKQARHWIENFLKKANSSSRVQNQSLGIATTTLVHEVFVLADHSKVRWPSTAKTPRRATTEPARAKLKPARKKRSKNTVVAATRVKKSPEVKDAPSNSANRPQRIRGGKAATPVAKHVRGTDNTGELAYSPSQKPQARSLNDFLDKYHQ